MNSLIKENHTLNKFLFDSRDISFGRTIEDILNNNFFDSYDASIREQYDSYTIELPVPGMTRKDITITVDEPVMWVAGQRQKENDSMRDAQFEGKHLRRSFTLPADADTNNIKAKCRNGLLTISIARLGKKGSHRIIQVAGDESNLELNNRVMLWWTRLVDRASQMLTRKRS